MSKQIKAVEAEIALKIAENRSNCDFICHALRDLGLDEELDVGPLRKNLESVSLGEGYGEFLIAVDNLMSCEPALDRSKINPMILEAWNFVYDTAKLKAKAAKLMLASLGDKPDKDRVLDLETQIQLEEQRVAEAMVGFAQFRAQMHVDLGNYRPAKTVEEVHEGKAGANYKTFLVQKGKKVMGGLKAGPGDVWQAVKDKDVGRVKQLMENEFVPDEYDMAHGGTPLHQATWDGETEICRLLLEYKANPNTQTLRGFTPMHFAMQHGHEDIVLLLKKHGGDVLIKSSMGQLPGGHS
eukprot:CAMPEP_0195524846 /NCGR_PEP_ID=MMETSP0794_2-20130614/24937_1 /TAXON_ID=515487 /ORGANISM="Stephanopyxis turris, Strain CCMP 815" /LENGTH=295 /DNA_ID=CAMNT_0040655163 /DNA_START=183 /DNA_END=1067 /DNA_ORIENTATION=-